MEKYIQICEIGKGNFGSISKIRRISDNKILVWKELDYGKMEEKDKHHIVSEVNILRELHHPNIVKYYDRIIDKKNTKIYIVMEYCSGGDIGQLIKRCRKNRELIEEEIIWKIFIQVILALNACHNFKEGKILHRDIKPSNIFLDNENNVKLGDFGLSKILSNKSNFAYSNVGTPYYMSPEQIDDHKYNEKSDIWSLGCFLYELTTLHPPFEATNHLSLAMKIKSGKVEKINSRYSHFLFKIINWLMNVNPNNRPFINELLNVPEINFRIRERKFKENFFKMKKYEESLNEREEKIKKKEIELDLREKYLDEREKNVKSRENRVSEREEFIKREFSMKINNINNNNINNNNINNNYNENYEKEGNENLNNYTTLIRNYSEYESDNNNFNDSLINKNSQISIKNKSDSNLISYYNYDNYNIKKNKNNVIKQKPKLNFHSSTGAKEIYHKPINLTNNTSLNTINTNGNSIHTQSINNTNNNQIKTLIYPNHKNYYSIDVNTNNINKLNFSPDSSYENVKKPPNIIYSHSKTYSSQKMKNPNYTEDISSNTNYTQTHDINYTYLNNGNSKNYTEFYNDKNNSQKYISDYDNMNNNMNDNEKNKSFSDNERLIKQTYKYSMLKPTIPNSYYVPNGNYKNSLKKNNKNNYSNTIENTQNNFYIKKERNYSSSHNILNNNNENKNNSIRESKTPRQRVFVMPRNNSYNLNHNLRCEDNNCVKDNNNINFPSYNSINTNYKKKNNSFRGIINSKDFKNLDKYN